MDFLRGVAQNALEASIIHQTLIEIRLLKIGIPYKEIQRMTKPEIDLYLGVYAGLEEKQNDDQQAAERASNAKMRSARSTR
jgi:hypothetical protein|tara:strand:+ start:2298 stop:2540 length:243 start_codon:yes stop_codon:yes gene_type:complete